MALSFSRRLGLGWDLISVHRYAYWCRCFSIQARDSRFPKLAGNVFFNIKLVLADQKCYEEVVISTSLFLGGYHAPSAYQWF